MSGIIISNQLPADLVVLSQEAIDTIDTAIEQAIALCGQPIDVESFAACNTAYKQLQHLASTLEAQRKAIKAPVLALCKQIDDAPREYVSNMDDARSKLGAVIKAFEVAENAKREALRQAAAYEAKMREQEAYEKAERERQEAIDDAPPDCIINVAEYVPIAPVAPAYTPSPIKSMVKSKTTYQLVIDDVNLIPVKLGTVRLLVPDEAALKQLLKAGMEIPGCRLVAVEGTMAKAGA